MTLLSSIHLRDRTNWGWVFIYYAWTSRQIWQVSSHIGQSSFILYKR